MRRLGAAGAAPTLLVLAALMVLASCAASPTPTPSVNASGVTPATARPRATDPLGEGTTTPPGTTPPDTAPVTEPPSTTTTTALAVIPAGTPLPGGPIRTTTIPPPPPAGPCPETTGTVTRGTFQSNVLQINQPQQHYRVYTPACYRWNPTTSYPVLYLLHGAQTDDKQWDELGLFPIADRLIASGEMPPTIIVLPDGIWAMGTYGLEPPLMERFVLGEVQPMIEQDYRTIKTRNGRAIGGISRGGEWSLIIGMRHPELFGAVGGHSPAVGPPGSPNNNLVPAFQKSVGQGQLLWLDVGSSDSLLGSVSNLDQGLDQAGVAHEFVVAPGGHDASYWNRQAESYLRFYTRSLAQAR